MCEQHEARQRPQQEQQQAPVHPPPMGSNEENLWGLRVAGQTPALCIAPVPDAALIFRVTCALTHLVQCL